MKKYISVMFALAMSFCLITCAFADSDSICEFNSENYVGADFEDDKVVFTVKSEYSCSDELAFDGEFFGIDEIISVERSLPIEFELKLRDKYPSYKSTYVATLSKHDKELVVEVIEKLYQSEYVAYAQPDYFYYPDSENSLFTNEQLEYIREIAAMDESLESYFTDDGKLNIDAIADLGNNMLVFNLCRDYQFGMSRITLAGDYYYIENIEDFTYVTVDDSVLRVCDAYDSELIDETVLASLAEIKTADFYRVGDINTDKSIDVSDVVRLRRHIVDFTDEYDVRVDINKDNRVNVLDLVMLRSVITNG